MFKIRIANKSDAANIAAAHYDSIVSIGPSFYSLEIVNDWASGLTADLYVKAMKQGETFFIAIPEQSKHEVLGFSSHRIDENHHGTAVYVRGNAARSGVGSALYRSAEAAARFAGATTIEIDSSLAAVAFYKSQGFEELGKGEHRLESGTLMPCVFMRKILTPK